MEFKENYTQQLQRLNEYQKAAVFDESNACLVNANVGSGKTTVLITKVMYLHYECFRDIIRIKNTGIRSF